jgi:RNA polymerase sigma factor FliA
LTNGRAQQAAELARRDHLVMQHLWLVKAIAVNKHENLPVQVELDDLVQAGMMGLIDAAKKFDNARQDVFSAYAKHRIKGAILDSLRQLDWASRDTRRRYNQVVAAKHELTATLFRDPMETEVAEKLGMSLDTWHVMRLHLENIGPVSADIRSNQWDDLPAMEFPSKPETRPDFICIQKELRSTLSAVIQTLPERYQRVIRLYYSKELTMRQIAGMLDINESRVSQIHKRALEMMATVMDDKGMDSIHAFQT